MTPGRIGELQRASSPVDRLGLASDGEARIPNGRSGSRRKSAAEPRLWRRGQRGETWQAVEGMQVIRSDQVSIVDALELNIGRLKRGNPRGRRQTSA